MPIINQTASVTGISSNFGVVVGMIAAGLVLIFIIWIFTQLNKV